MRRIDRLGVAPKVLANPLDDGRFLDARNHPQRAAAAPAGFIGHIPVADRFAAACSRANRPSRRLVDIDGKGTLEALRPGEGPLPGAGRRLAARLALAAGNGPTSRYHPRPIPARRREHTVISGQVGSRPRHERSQSGAAHRRRRHSAGACGVASPHSTGGRRSTYARPL